MRTIIRSYEPFFGGIVAVLAAALPGYVLLAWFRPGSHSGTAYLFWYSGMGLSWGLLQIVGYRRAKRRHVRLEAPSMDAAMSCVLVGVFLALATVILYAVAGSAWYFIATGTAAAALLGVGAMVGIRQGTWRG